MHRPSFLASAYAWLGLAGFSAALADIPAAPAMVRSGAGRRTLYTYWDGTRGIKRNRYKASWGTPKHLRVKP